MQAAAAGLLLLLSPTLKSLPDDRNQAIEISADRAVRDERAGFTLYSGDVVLDQGSLHIEADRLTIFHDRESADRIIADGEPARLRQQPTLEDAPIHAEARRIVYFKSRERVVLTNAARIEQDGAIVSGESIQYLMAEQRVLADASREDRSDRVQVTIPAATVAESDERQRSNGAQSDRSSSTVPTPAESPVADDTPPTDSDDTVDKTNGSTNDSTNDNTADKANGAARSP